MKENKWFSFKATEQKERNTQPGVRSSKCTVQVRVCKSIWACQGEAPGCCFPVTGRKRHISSGNRALKVTLEIDYLILWPYTVNVITPLDCCSPASNCAAKRGAKGLWRQWKAKRKRGLKRHISSQKNYRNDSILKLLELFGSTCQNVNNCFVSMLVSWSAGRALLFPDSPPSGR